MVRVKKGATVTGFERQFAAYVGAQYCIGMTNGTSTLHAALVAIGVGPGDRVAVPPLTMSATTLAVLHAGAIPHFADVRHGTWLMESPHNVRACVPVSLYGLAHDYHGMVPCTIVDDAAQTLRQHRGAAFTSYSFEGSKILSCGEGGALVTSDSRLAERAREFASLGYRLGAGSSRIDSQTIRSPTYQRHHSIGYNYRMSDLQAAHLLTQLERADELLAARKYAADCYREAVQGCEWITPQYVPAGWDHSFWTYAFAVKTPGMWEPLAQAIVKAGGERPYACWRVTYQEPALRHLAKDGTCPVAEDLQPRIFQLQTNMDKVGSEQAAERLHAAILSL